MLKPQKWKKGPTAKFGRPSKVFARPFGLSPFGIEVTDFPNYRYRSRSHPNCLGTGSRMSGSINQKASPPRRVGWFWCMKRYAANSATWSYFHRERIRDMTVQTCNSTYTLKVTRRPNVLLARNLLTSQLISLGRYFGRIPIEGYPNAQ